MHPIGLISPLYAFLKIDRQDASKQMRFHLYLHIQLQSITITTATSCSLSENNVHQVSHDQMSNGTTENIQEKTQWQENFVREQLNTIIESLKIAAKKTSPEYEIKDTDTDLN